MVHRTLRKRRSKRSMTRSIKRYRRHAKTRIRRNMYRKKHKKTQRGGVRFSNLLPGRLKFSRASGLKFSTPLQTYTSMNGNQELSYYIGDEKTNIQASGDTNTLNGKRYLKGTIKIFNSETKDFTDDGDILYFLINSVVERTSKFYVSVRHILFKNPDTVYLSSNVNDDIILQKKSGVDNDNSSYVVIQGFLPNKVNDKLQVVTSITGVDLKDIPDPYNGPDTY